MRARRWLPILVVFAIAAAARLTTLFGGGHPLNVPRYDEGVYYAAAAALVHGRFPYHGDVVLVHPPVIALVGTPFALLARLTDDPTGFLAENTAFALVGALNAVLVVVVARAWGFRRGALLAGLAYAMWPVVSVPEATARLEPIGNLFLLLSLWALARGRDGGTRPLVLAGVLLGVLVNVKLWWCAPALTVLALTAVAARSRRAFLVPALAAGTTALVLDLPFFLVAGRRMFRSIVLAQLDRSGQRWAPGGLVARISAAARLGQFTGAHQAVTGAPAGRLDSPNAVVAVVAWVVVGAFVATAVLACREPAGRVFVALVAVQVAVLLAAPVYYAYYGAYIAPAAALVVAAAAGRGAPREGGPAPEAVAGPANRPRRSIARRGAIGMLLAGSWVVAAAVAGVIAINGLTTQPGPAVDWSALRRQTEGVRCLVADSAYALIRLDALDRSLRPGCRNVVDFQGLSYGAGPDPRVRARGPFRTPEYRQFLTDYLMSGDAVVQSSPYTPSRLGAAGRRRLEEGALLARSGKVTVRWTTDTPPDLAGPG